MAQSVPSTSSSPSGLPTLSLLAAMLAPGCGDTESGTGPTADGATGGSLAGGASSTGASTSALPTGGQVGSGAVAGAGGSDEATGGNNQSTGGGDPTGGSGGSADVVEQEVAFLVEPTFEGNDVPRAPLAGVLSLETDVPARVTVTVTGSGEQWTLELAPGSVFRQPILGLLPETEYEVSVSVTAGINELLAGPLTWTSPALPADLPTITTTSEPDAMEPGMTFFSIRSGQNAANSPLVIVDHQGRVRWYYWDRDWPSTEDSRLLENGHVLYNTRSCQLHEVDLLGNVVARYHPENYPGTNCDTAQGSIPVPVDSFHHEMSRPPALGGDYLILSTELRSIPDFPSSETNESAPTETAEVSGTVIVEFTPEGEVTRRISLLDLMPPTRIGRDSLSTGTTAGWYGNGTRDWDHANAVIYDAASDAYYVSQRHQDVLLKIDRSTEELLWILGSPVNFPEQWAARLLTPIGSLEWPYHQHAVELTPLGVGIFDNGNYRAGAFETPTQEWSRVVVFSVDEEAMTVSEAWSYGEPSGPDSFYSPAMGDADWQPTSGNCVFVDASQAQVVEVTADGTRVMEMTAGGAGLGSGSASLYRAQRIPDLRTLLNE